VAGAATTEEDPVVQFGARCLVTAGVLLLSTMTGCDTAVPFVTVPRVLHLTGIVEGQMHGAAGGEIKFTPDPSGACPPVKSQTTALAPVVVAPLEADGTFSARLWVEYDASEPAPPTLCTFVEVFLAAGGEQADTTLTGGPWAFGRISEALGASLTVAF
jgi:hypothetical protein